MQPLHTKTQARTTDGWHKGLRIMPSLHTCKARDGSKTSYFQTQKPVNRAKTVIQVGKSALYSPEAISTTHYLQYKTDSKCYFRGLLDKTIPKYGHRRKCVFLLPFVVVSQSLSPQLAQVFEVYSPSLE